MFCMRDSAKAQEILDHALLANPYDEVLRNNKVVVLAEKNQVDVAEEILGSLPRSSPHQENWEAILQATTGLVAFRRGNSAAGRALYERVTELLTAKKNAEQMAIALAYWAREEVLAETPASDAVLERAIGANKNLRAPHINEWLSVLRQLRTAQGR
jgi:hypothetical protein